MSSIKQRKTPDDGARTLKRQPHRTKDEYSEILTYGNKTSKNEQFNGIIYFQLLGFDFECGKLVEKFGNRWGSERRFCFDLNHFFQKGIHATDSTNLPGPKLEDKGYHEQYQLVVSYNDNEIQAFRILWEGKNLNKAGQRVFVGVDISPGYSENISGEYTKDEAGNLVLQKFRKGAQPIWDKEQGRYARTAETALISNDFSFIIPQIITPQDGCFVVNHIQSNERLIRFPEKLTV